MNFIFLPLDRTSRAARRVPRNRARDQGNDDGSAACIFIILFAILLLTQTFLPPYWHGQAGEAVPAPGGLPEEEGQERGEGAPGGEGAQEEDGGAAGVSGRRRRATPRPRPSPTLTRRTPPSPRSTPMTVGEMAEVPEESSDVAVTSVTPGTRVIAFNIAANQAAMDAARVLGVTIV